VVARLAWMRVCARELSHVLSVSVYVPRACRVSPCSCAGQDPKAACTEMSVGSLCRRAGRLRAPVAGDCGAAAARVDARGAVERLPHLGWFWRGMPLILLRSAIWLADAPFWQGLVVFHGNLNKGWLEGILEETGMSGVVLKPLGVDNLTREMYSCMFCDARFYDNFPTSHVLVFQTDVMMRRRIPAKFFDFAYVGAPFHGFHQMHGGLKCIGNGGYSLRNVEEMKRLLTANNWVEWNQQLKEVEHEDVFIGARSNPARLPFNHEACEFSVEHVWHPNPTGMHKPFSPGHRAPAFEPGAWQHPPWAEKCPERPLWEDRYFSTDMLESLFECVADPDVASDTHKHSAHQTTDMALPNNAWEQMQNAAHAVPYQLTKGCFLTPLASGLKWEESGVEELKGGVELYNAELASALKSKQEFSREEIDEFGGVLPGSGVPYNCFINANGRYFKPVADWWGR
jgi:hypothetical protein